jgi:hypothetical protein
MKLQSITEAHDGKHKYEAKFLQDNGRIKTTKFGAKGYSDYTQHHDKERRERYLARHSGMGEHWNEPMTAEHYLKHLLWGESTSFSKNVAELQEEVSSLSDFGCKPNHNLW